VAARQRLDSAMPHDDDKWTTGPIWAGLRAAQIDFFHVQGVHGASPQRWFYRIWWLDVSH
jgi:hypothetical protein